MNPEDIRKQTLSAAQNLSQYGVNPVSGIPKIEVGGIRDYTLSQSRDYFPFASTSEPKGFFGTMAAGTGVALDAGSSLLGKLVGFIPQPVKNVASSIKTGIESALSNPIGLFGVPVAQAPESQYAAEHSGLPSVIYPLQRLTGGDISKPTALEQGLQYGAGRYANIVTGGIINPKYEIPDSVGKTLIDVASTVVGFRRVLGTLKSGMLGIAENTPKLSSFVQSFPTVSNWLAGIGAFSVYGQLNPELGTDLSQRLKQLAIDAPMGVVFESIPFLKGVGPKVSPLKIPVGSIASFTGMGGLGYGLAKLHGDSDRDALIWGTTFGILDLITPNNGYGRPTMSKEVSERLLAREARDTLRKEGIKIEDNYSDKDLDVKRREWFSDLRKNERGVFDGFRVGEESASRRVRGINSAIDILRGTSREARNFGEVDSQKQTIAFFEELSRMFGRRQGPTPERGAEPTEAPSPAGLLEPPGGFSKRTDLVPVGGTVDIDGQRYSIPVSKDLLSRSPSDVERIIQNRINTLEARIDKGVSPETKANIQMRINVLSQMLERVDPKPRVIVDSMKQVPSDGYLRDEFDRIAEAIKTTPPKTPEQFRALMNFSYTVADLKGQLKVVTGKFDPVLFIENVRKANPNLYDVMKKGRQAEIARAEIELEKADAKSINESFAKPTLNPPAVQPAQGAIRAEEPAKKPAKVSEKEQKRLTAAVDLIAKKTDLPRDLVEKYAQDHDIDVRSLVNIRKNILQSAILEDRLPPSLEKKMQVGITSSQEIGVIKGHLAKGKQLLSEGKPAEALAEFQKITKLTQKDLNAALSDGSTKILRLEQNTFGLYFGDPEASYWLTVDTNNPGETLASLADFARRYKQDSFITADAVKRGSGEGTPSLRIDFGRALAPEEVVKIQEISNGQGMGLTLNQEKGEAVSYNIQAWDEKTPVQFIETARETLRALREAGMAYAQAGVDNVAVNIYTEDKRPYTAKTYGELIEQSKRLAGRSEPVERGIEGGGEAPAGIAAGSDAGGVAPGGTEGAVAISEPVERSLSAAGIVEKTDQQAFVRHAKKLITIDEALSTKLLDRIQVEAKSPEVSSQYIRDQANRADIKKVEREIVLDMLKEYGDGPVKISEFREKVQAQLLPLAKIESDTYSDYGLDSVELNDSIGIEKTRTHIYNSPYLHGRPGHFSSDFPSVKYEYDMIENGEGMFDIYRREIGTQPWGQPYKVFGNKENAEHFMQAASQASEQKVGLFSHARVWDAKDGAVRYVSEIQSDAFQSGRVSTELSRDQSDLITSQIEENEWHNLYNYLSGFSEEGWKENISHIEDRLKEFVLNNSLRTNHELYAEPGYRNYADRSDRLQFMLDQKIILQNVGAELDKIRELSSRLQKKVDEGKLTQSALERMFFSYENRWHERTIREEIRDAALAGKTALRFPAPRTVAKIEGFMGDEAPYITDKDELDVGDEIEFNGDTYKVVEASSEQITVAPADKVRSFLHSDAVRESIDSRWDDVEYDFRKIQEDFGPIESPKDAKRVLSNIGKLNEYIEAKNAPENLKSYLEIKDPNEYQKGQIERFKALIKAGVPKPPAGVPKKLLTAKYLYSGESDMLLEKMAESDLDSFTASDFEEDVKRDLEERESDQDYEGIYGKGNVFYREHGRYDTQVTVVEDGTHVENLGQPGTYSSTPGDVFDYEEQMGRDQATVIRFYDKQVLPFVQKIRRGNWEMVKDAAENEWLETKITPEDRGPVEAYSIVRDVQEAFGGTVDQIVERGRNELMERLKGEMRPSYYGVQSIRIVPEGTDADLIRLVDRIKEEVRKLPPDAYDENDLKLMEDIIRSVPRESLGGLDLEIVNGLGKPMNIDGEVFKGQEGDYHNGIVRLFTGSKGLSIRTFAHEFAHHYHDRFLTDEERAVVDEAYREFLKDEDLAANLFSVNGNKVNARATILDYVNDAVERGISVDEMLQNEFFARAFETYVDEVQRARFEKKIEGTRLEKFWNMLKEIFRRLLDAAYRTMGWMSETGAKVNPTIEDIFRRIYEPHFEASGESVRLSPMDSMNRLIGGDRYGRYSRMVMQRSSRSVEDYLRELEITRAQILKDGGNADAIDRLIDRVRKEIPQAAVPAGDRPQTAVSVDGEVREPIKTKVPVPAQIANNLSSWKDKSAISLSRETMDRNIDDVAGENAPYVKAFLTDPIKVNETARSEFITQLRDEIRKTVVQDMGIRAGSKDDALIMQYGEGRIDLSQLKEQSPKWEQINKAAGLFRSYYDELLSMVNVERAKYGYEPIPKRPDYFRHFQEIGFAIKEFGMILKQEDLPTEISGMTGIFKPGKPFSSAELQRKGGPFTESAIKGFDNYLDSISRQIFHIDSVQRGRSLEKYIRESSMQDSEVKLPNFVANLMEATNLISGKKSQFDRSFESLFGRPFYGVMNFLKNRTSANMIGANIGSAMTNFIPITQSLAATRKMPALRGLGQATLHYGDHTKIDGVRSGFITRRFPERTIDITGLAKAEEIAGWIFKTVDQFVSRFVVAGKYYEKLEDGMAPEQAMKEADEFAAKVMADRSIGQLPNLFGVRTIGFLTQFQTEINNQASFIFKDIPKEARGNISKMVSMFAQLAIYSLLFNEMFKKIAGRRPALDPIYAAMTLVGATEEGRDEGFWRRAYFAGKDIAGNLPFTGGITGGRLPIASGFPNINALARGETTLATEVQKPVAFFLFPLGGLQAKKMFEGLKAYITGGSYTQSGKLRYPVQRSVDTFLKMMLFGQYSVPQASEYFNSELGALSEQQTALYKALIEKGREEDAFRLYEMVMRQKAGNKIVNELMQEAKESGKAPDKEKVNNAKERLRKLFGR